MSFATVVGDRQLAYITKILAIFGVVEERQMRELFSYLPAAKYGRSGERTDGRIRSLFQ